MSVHSLTLASGFYRRKKRMEVSVIWSLLRLSPAACALQWVSASLISPPSSGRSEQRLPTWACARTQEVRVRGWWLKQHRNREEKWGEGCLKRKKKGGMRWLKGTAAGSVLWQERGFGSSCGSFFFTVSCKATILRGTLKEMICLLSMALFEAHTLLAVTSRESNHKKASLFQHIYTSLQQCSSET